LPQVGAPQVQRYRDSAYKGARERPDTSGNSGGTADITRQLVRPELSGQQSCLFSLFSGGKTLWNVPRSVSLFKNTPADGTEITVCGWAKNIRDSKNIGFIALSDGGCFKTLQVVLEAGKLANYDEVIHTGLYSSLRIKGKLVLTPQASSPLS